MNLHVFLSAYRTNLEKAHAERPTEYAWPISEIEIVFDRMAMAIKQGSFNKDSRAFKLTCKQLGIKHTYRSIREFIND